MSNFTDALKKGFSKAATVAGKVTKNVAEKTGIVVDITKLNIALADTEKKISDTKEKIGEMVYAQYLEGTLDSDKFDDILKELDAFKAEEDGLKAQIAELKNTTTCEKCGQSNDRSSEFCSKCGSKLFETNEESEDKVIEVTEITEDE